MGGCCSCCGGAVRTKTTKHAARGRKAETPGTAPAQWNRAPALSQSDLPGWSGPPSPQREPLSRLCVRTSCQSCFLQYRPLQQRQSPRSTQPAALIQPPPANTTAIQPQHQIEPALPQPTLLEHPYAPCQRVRALRIKPGQRACTNSARVVPHTCCACLPDAAVCYVCDPQISAKAVHRTPTHMFPHASMHEKHERNSTQKCL